MDHTLWAYDAKTCGAKKLTVEVTLERSIVINAEEVATVVRASCTFVGVDASFEQEFKKF